MGYASVADIIGVNNELKERVENWGKYSEGLISRLPDYKEITKKQKDIKDPIIGGTTFESVVGNSNVRTTNGNNAEERTYDKNIKKKQQGLGCWGSLTVRASGIPGLVQWKVFMKCFQGASIIFFATILM